MTQRKRRYGRRARSPLLRSPLLKSPLLKNPILRNPLLRNPLLRNPLLRSPLLSACVYGKRGEKVNNQEESLQLSRKDQVSISRLSSGHHPYLKFWPDKIGIALDTVCRNSEWGRRLLNTQWESVLESTTLQPS